MGNVRDMVSGLQLVLDHALFEIKPTIAGEEWSVHNIYIPSGKMCSVVRIRAGIGIEIIDTNMSLIGDFNFHCSTEEYIGVVNNSGETIALSFDGVVTRTS